MTLDWVDGRSTMSPLRIVQSCRFSSEAAPVAAGRFWWSWKKRWQSRSSSRELDSVMAEVAVFGEVDLALAEEM